MTTILLRLAFVTISIGKPSQSSIPQSRQLSSQFIEELCSTLALKPSLCRVLPHSSKHANIYTRTTSCLSPQHRRGSRNTLLSGVCFDQTAGTALFLEFRILELQLLCERIQFNKQNKKEKMQQKLKAYFLFQVLICLHGKLFLKLDANIIRRMRTCALKTQKTVLVCVKHCFFCF